MFVTVVPGKAFVGLMRKEVVPGACLVWVGVSLCFIGRKHRRNPIYDWELFLRKMMQVRGWSEAKADAKWKELASDNSNLYDNNGPPPHTPRLRVPAALVGGESVDSDEEKCEEHKLQECNKLDAKA